MRRRASWRKSTCASACRRGLASRAASLSGRVALLVHRRGTPGGSLLRHPAHSDYSWMAHLARGGYDVFAMDTTGYGRSTHPAEMNDLCNLSAEQQKALVPALLAGALRRDLPAPDDYDCFGLERHQRGGRFRPRVAPCGRGRPAGLVAGRAARGRLGVATSGRAWKNSCSARSGVQPRIGRGAAGESAGRWDCHGRDDPRTIPAIVGRTGGLPE